VEEAVVPRENHRLVASHWQTLSHNVVPSTTHHERVGFELTTLVTRSTDCLGSFKSNYHTITATRALPVLWYLFQVLLKASSYLAISTYGVVSLIATVVAIVLPIETKGREMKVSYHSYCTYTNQYLLMEGPGWLNDNSYKPITNTAWVLARLCKLQKRVHSTWSHKW